MNITKPILIAGVAISSLLFMAGEAEAARRDYCREYTKTVKVGGNVKTAYGKACLQPDGDWTIVSYRGDDDLYDDLVRQAYKHKIKRKIQKYKKTHRAYHDNYRASYGMYGYGQYDYPGRYGYHHRQCGH